MTIQLPILLWTLITFALTMLVLQKLLFRPMLSFMDKRQAKIDRAKAIRESRAAEMQAAEEQTEANRRAAQHKNAELAAQEIRDAKTRADGIVEKAKTEEEIALAACRREALYRKSGNAFPCLVRPSPLRSASALKPTFFRIIKHRRSVSCSFCMP